MCLCRIMACHLDDYILEEEILQEALLRLICTVQQCQLQPYRHMAYFWKVNPAHWIVLLLENTAWRRPRGCSQTSWLEQIDRSCVEILRMGRWPTWSLAWRVPPEVTLEGGHGDASFEWLVDWSATCKFKSTVAVAHTSYELFHWILCISAQFIFSWPENLVMWRESESCLMPHITMTIPNEQVLLQLLHEGLCEYCISEKFWIVEHKRMLTQVVWVKIQRE